MRDRYWAFYVSIKHKSCYYKHFQILFSAINWGISAFLGLTTLSCIATLGIWQQYAMVWSSIILAAQVVQALFPKLPYNDLLISTKFMVTETERLLLDIDHDWLYIDIHSSTIQEDEILQLLQKHESRYFDLVNQFFSGTYLPEIKYCSDRAERDCRTFFTVTYNT